MIERLTSAKDTAPPTLALSNFQPWPNVGFLPFGLPRTVEPSGGPRFEYISGSFGLPRTVEPLNGPRFDISVSFDLPRTVEPAGVEVLQGVSRTPYISLVWELAGQQQLRAARRLLAFLSDDPSLRGVRRLLSPPETSSSARRSTDRAADYEWLSRHGHEYCGQWIAILGGALVAAKPTLQELRQRLGELSLASPPLLHHVE